MTDRKLFLKNFSRRLRNLMVEAGYTTKRTCNSPDAKLLAKYADCSYQMARRYLLGNALPDIHQMPKIAAWLNTTSSWILFGENEIKTIATPGAIIQIEPELLKYILLKSVPLFTLIGNEKDLVNFLTGCIYDTSHLNTDQKTIYKIIDMMFSSTQLFKITPEKIKENI